MSDVDESVTGSCNESFLIRMSWYIKYIVIRNITLVILNGGGDIQILDYTPLHQRTVSPEGKCSKGWFPRRVVSMEGNCLRFPGVGSAVNDRNRDS